MRVQVLKAYNLNLNFSSLVKKIERLVYTSTKLYVCIATVEDEDPIITENLVIYFSKILSKQFHETLELA